MSKAYKHLAVFGAALALGTMVEGAVFAQEGKADDGQTIEFAVPTLEDQTPTLNGVEPTVELDTNESGSSINPQTNPIVALVETQPRCAREVTLPAEAGEPVSAGVIAELEEQDCVPLVDAMPMLMTPNGPVPIATSTGTATEDQILLRLDERREQLEARERELAGQQDLLEAASLLLDQRALELSAIEERIGSLVDGTDAREQETIAELASLYETMKPKDAAIVLEGMPDDVLVAIARGMTSRKLAAVLAEMKPDRARALTVMMVDARAMPAP